MNQRETQRKGRNLTDIYKRTDIGMNVMAKEIHSILKSQELDTVTNTRETNTKTKERDVNSASITRERNGITKTSLTTKDVHARATTLRKPRKP